MNAVTDPTIETPDSRTHLDQPEVESPRAFYDSFTRRTDVREILRRLAIWQPPTIEPPADGER